MILNDKDMDVIGKVLLVIFCFLMLMFSIESNAQTFTVTKDELRSNYVIDFIDEYNDSYYINGDKVIIRGKLDLTQKEYKQLIKDIKKALKYKEYEVDRPSYAVIKYSFIRDSVWVYYNEKAFSAVKLDLDYLNSKL
tara:strand:+ start:2339 stop:2749 length:411 start_codon:yes stop_codon:yes gene_type:complete